MRIHHLNCGTMRPLGGRLVSGTGHPLTFARNVCHCLLVETDQGLVLIDTGLGLGDVRDPARLSPRFRFLVRPVLDEAETAAQQVLRLGFQLSDVQHIVLTHLDVDHAGGLGDFPHAKVHLYAAELEAALKPLTALERFRYHAAHWAHDPDWVPHSSAGEPWFGFSAVRDLPKLPPQILLVPLAGHTRGHAGVAIDTGRSEPGAPRWLLHAGDAYFHHAQVAPRPSCPPISRAFQTFVQADRTSRLHNLHRLNELAATGKVDIICAHDPDELDRAQGAQPLTRLAGPSGDVGHAAWSDGQ
ncbi:MBL fold metallo-hydrolase [Actinomadura opuntiae]|uniref:MBL fold metallo-hydrolase n=1 Tax=Actinomadura sp. OS1-43 TaxID=604315 RepID=UPI00255A8FDA|nr:MBL fold metallo-hydrolase [Actinomadura sp. OS1-43]MDL4817338.1 MBL fold metallo-hydrolase [Actinomadura sp. OS1-43]